MKRLAILLLLGGLAASLRAHAETNCPRVAVPSRIATERGELTLADLLVPGSCEQLRRAAAQVHLGTAPGSGSVRVFDGRQIRERLERLSGGSSKLKKTVLMQVPERISVRPAGAVKSCGEFAGFVANAAPIEKLAGSSSGWPEKMDCAAAPNIPEATPLELTKSSWSASLQRWEFAVRCARPEDCVPFLLWFREENTSRAALVRKQTGITVAMGSKISGNSPERLVKRGQTATLTWDQGGIRIVLPVTCLEGGGLGQSVRVQFKNTPRIVRAEVVGNGTLRASL